MPAMPKMLYGDNADALIIVGEDGGAVPPESVIRSFYATAKTNGADVTITERDGVGSATFQVGDIRYLLDVTPGNATMMVASLDGGEVPVPDLWPQAS